MKKFFPLPVLIAGLAATVTFIVLKKKGDLKNMRVLSKVKSSALRTMNRARMILANDRGDFYISDGVKIIIAVVLGALLLAALTNIFNGTVIPRITREIEALFG